MEETEPFDHQSQRPGTRPWRTTGFPSPAEDYADATLDLNTLLLHHPAASYFMIVQGRAMEAEGIHPGDILVVDRAIAPTHNRIVIATVNEQLVVRRLRIRNKQITLVSGNPNDTPVVLDSATSLRLWGVVTHVIHPLLGPFAHRSLQHESSDEH